MQQLIPNRKMLEGDLKKENIRLFVGMPMYAGMVSEPTFRSVLSLQRWCDNNGITMGVKTATNESLISRARNTLVSMFLDDEVFLGTHLLFIDSDIGFKPLNIERLIRYNKDITCGIYPKKVIHWDQIINAVKANPNIDKDTLESISLSYNLNFNDPENIVLTNGFCEVKECATGLMLIKRNVFDKMKISYPEKKYISDQLINESGYSSENCYDFFGVGKLENDPKQRYLSEDYYFSRLWERCGGKIYADITQPLTHFGSMAFRGDISKMFKVKT